jgi:neutral trehalase
MDPDVLMQIRDCDIFASQLRAHQCRGVACDRKDVEAAVGLSSTEASQKYREIASTAESGWDFSTRWSSSTTHIIPTDLNCFLLMMERNMQRFAQAS